MRSVACIVCRAAIEEGERFVLVQKGRHAAHCSEACLVETMQAQRRARAAARWRWILGAAAVALVLVGTDLVWRRLHMPHPTSISYDPPVVRPVAVRPEPIFYGPAWPPTDEDWLHAFTTTAWIYPLPGPTRHPPAVDDRILTPPEPAVRRGRGPATPPPSPVCREPGRCGVDLGGDLWGEHVYAAHDGIVDRVQHAVGDEPGGVYLRLAHFGGNAFTHYVHLAAVPRTLVRGVQVKAGEIIGLVGETGNEHPGRYVHFALSVHPSPDFAEVYWDPRALMMRWPLHVPPHGTVAGFLPPQTDLAPPPFRHRSR
jgi:predicted nucleic acid-binding Zn ribbon protein